jgi:hypothetical protein
MKKFKKVSNKAAYNKKKRLARKAAAANIGTAAEGVSITGHDAIKAHFEERARVARQIADEFVNNMTNNFDFTLLQEAAFKSKQHTLHGKNFRVNIFVGGRASETLAKKSGLDVGAVVQIWRGAKSVLIAQPKADLADARLNWRDEARIGATDVVSQSIALLRLSAGSNALINDLAFELAYNNDGVDVAGIHAVWD